MKKLMAFSILVFILFLVSCDKDNDLDNQPDTKDLENQLTTKIPIDSIFFSCNINNQLIEFKSPSAENVTWKDLAQRLNKIKNSTKDSILISYSKGFINEHYRVEISFSESVLLEIDTTTIWLTVPNQKNVLLKKGIHNVQYLEQGWDYKEATAKYSGFRINITDRLNNISYSSYVRFRDPNISTEYSDFKSKSSFEITELTELNTGIYKDYSDAWFFNSKFHCKLYIDSDTSKPAILTDGVLNCCF